MYKFGSPLGGEKTGLFRPVRNRMLPGAEDLPPQQKRLLILQAGDAGQLQAFQELQGSAAAGGDVGDLVGIAQLFRSRRSSR